MIENNSSDVDTMLKTVKIQRETQMIRKTPGIHLILFRLIYLHLSVQLLQLVHDVGQQCVCSQTFVLFQVARYLCIS